MPFRDVVGHSRVVAWLQRQVASGAVGHAYLFLGPPGIGKRFLALQMAQALHCLSAREGEACSRCAACQQVAAGRYPDVLTVAVPDGATQIKIEQIRELQHWLAFTPFHGGRKVAIVDDADTMQEPAASALLKTLEEPPPSAVLLLVAASETRLLPTIVSRCARVSCGPLPTSALQAVLAADRVAPARAAAVTRVAAGRLGRARELASQDVWDRRQAVLEEWRAAVAAGTVEPGLAARPREEIEQALETIAAWYHDLVLVQHGADDAALIYADRAAVLRTDAACWTPERLLAAVEAVYATQALIQQRVNPRAALAVLVAQLAPTAARP